MSAPTEPLFLGVDGGGSKTVAVLVDAAGRERGRGHAGGSNYRTVGLDAAVAQIQCAVQTALAMAGSDTPCAAGWFGLAGIDDLADADTLRPRLAALAGTLRLTNDAEMVLAALENGTGVALIAGAGAIALGSDGHGACARARRPPHDPGPPGGGVFHPPCRPH
jgi:glucosamine kinase